MTCARLTSKTRHRSDPRPNHHPHDRRLDHRHHRAPSVPQLVSIVSWQEANVCPPNIGGCVPKAVTTRNPLCLWHPLQPLQPPPFAPNPWEVYVLDCTVHLHKIRIHKNIFSTNFSHLFLQFATANRKLKERSSVPASEDKDIAILGLSSWYLSVQCKVHTRPKHQCFR